MPSRDGDDPMTSTDLSKKQLTTILSALDDAPRSPANKGEALRAIGRSAKRFGLTTEMSSPPPPACSTAASARPTSGSSCRTGGGAGPGHGRARAHP